MGDSSAESKSFLADTFISSLRPRLYEASKVSRCGVPCRQENVRLWRNSFAVRQLHELRPPAYF